VYLCKFNMDNRDGYRRVISWSISMASSESAVWLGLEQVGWSIRGLGPHGVCGCGVDMGYVLLRYMVSAC
jgi:hypothetical protein